MSKNIDTLRSQVADLEARLVKKREQLANAEALTKVEVGATVTYMYGRGAGKVERTGEVLGSTPNPHNEGVFYTILTGEGAETEVNRVSGAAITGIVGADGSTEAVPQCDEDESEEAGVGYNDVA